MKNKGFTLAEVLITLGVIGVVAALTIPVLIENHNKKIVVTRLKKVYTTMNQAIKMAELEYGDRKEWFENKSGLDRTFTKQWVDKYLVPYLNVVDTDYVMDGYTLYFADGSAIQVHYSRLRDWYFYPGGNIEKCVKKHIPNKSITNVKYSMGKCAFAFYYDPIAHYSSQPYNFEPFQHAWNGTLEDLLNDEYYGCNTTEVTDTNWKAYCTKLIQYSGWQIPDNYPFKVHP